MKSLLVKFGVLIIGLLILGNGEVWGADWKLYFSHKYVLVYYDLQSITPPSKNIVRVWTKSDITEKGVMNLVERNGKKYENSSDVRILWEINCLEKTYRFLSWFTVNNKGEAFESYNSPSKWRLIIPESGIEFLYEEICK